VAQTALPCRCERCESDTTFAATLVSVATSKGQTENEMGRYAIALFLLFLLGIAVEELVAQSGMEPGQVEPAAEGSR